MHTTLRAQRLQRGLSQGALADLAGVSRQALWAVESGRQVPSTAFALRLARALDCTVEALFSLAEEHVVEARALGDVPVGARVRIASVDEQPVAFAARGAERADGVVRAARASALDVALFGPPPERVAIAGCAPLIGLAAHHTPHAYWVSANSARALAALRDGLVHVAGIHLESEAGQGHHDIVQAALPDVALTVVSFTTWRVGLVLPAGNPRGITSAADVVAAGLRCVQREDGAAVRTLQERWIGASDGPLAASHDEVARLVRWGLADVGVAIEPVALEYQLHFVPLIEERFDLVVPTARLAQDAVAQFLNTLERPTFKADAAACSGYDMAGSGHAAEV